MFASAPQRRSEGPGQERCVWPDSCDSNSHTEARIIRHELADYEGLRSSRCCRASRQPPVVFRRGRLNPMLAEDATGKQLRLIRNNVKPRR